VSAVRFAGFPDRMTYVPVPAGFFGTLLREIDSLAELKATLHLWRLLHERRTSPRYLRRSELLADRALLLALLTEDAERPERALEAGLKKATDRGTLVTVTVRDGDAEDVCYLLNTDANRRLVRQVEDGERRLGPFEAAPTPVEVGPRDESRPTIFELYEQNVGLLTPLLAEQLREAELSYSEAWIEDAFREAVSQNKRSWRYIQRVLENWAARGRGTRGETGRRPGPPEDPRAYLAGKHGHLIRR
jgi:DNA replication protein